MLADTDNPFVTFGGPHVAVLVLTAAVPLGLVLLSRTARSAVLTRTICVAVAAVLVANEVGFWCYGLAVGDWQYFLQHHLPLHICGVAIFLTAWVLVRPHQLAYEVAYFWGLAGTIQAIITPELDAAFPTYRFFQYFITHVGIVVGVLLATLGLKMRPRAKSILIVFVLTNAYMLVVAGLNLLIGGQANYMFLCRAPQVRNPLIFLPWPWYILFLEPVGMAMLVILYLPFLPGARRQREGRHER